MIGTLSTSIAGGTSLRFRPSNSFQRRPPFSAVLGAKPVAGRRTTGRPESLYEILRVERNATLAEIKTAYRSLAKVYHPDASDLKQHQQDDERDFVEIHDAYATLSDPETRAMYDLRWSAGMRRNSGLYTAVGKRQGVYAYAGRRWETDQCW